MTPEPKPTTGKGKLSYVFKGMPMSEIPVEVVAKDDRNLVAKDSAGKIYNFLKISTDWLLKEHTSSNSLLFGTRFTE